MPVAVEPASNLVTSCQAAPGLLRGGCCWETRSSITTNRYTEHRRSRRNAGTLQDPPPAGVCTRDGCTGKREPSRLIL
jgi:hypothetical protein